MMRVIQNKALLSILTEIIQNNFFHEVRNAVLKTLTFRLLFSWLVHNHNNLLFYVLCVLKSLIEFELKSLIDLAPILTGICPFQFLSHDLVDVYWCQCPLVLLDCKF